MRLPDFILDNLEPILMEWETFARSLASGISMQPIPLRDNARNILLAVVDDMRSAETPDERSAKSKGHAPVQTTDPDPDTLDGASELHAVSRLGFGFDLMEVVSEYRALRASVLQLWGKTNPPVDEFQINDLTRFNESIDQSMARAVNSYTCRVDQARDMFLAILSHDLRSPLSAISMSAEILKMTEAATHQAAVESDGYSQAIEPIRAAERITANVDVMGRMIGDLLDYTRTRLGAGLPVEPAMMDLASLCKEVLAEYRTAHPKREIRFQAHGNTRGKWDADRLRQAISNLLGNAVQHGDPQKPIEFTLLGDTGGIILSIQNFGEPILPGELQKIFLPLIRGSATSIARTNRPGSIGLGLYIAREIDLTHGGRIEVASDLENGTVFTVYLPCDTQTETHTPILDEEHIVKL